MTDTELVTWIRETLAAYDRLPQALGILATRGMSFGEIGRQTEMRKGTVYRKVPAEIRDALRARKEGTTRPPSSPTRSPVTP